MKTTSKRILSMLLVFVMVFSLLPGYALAADEQPVIDFDPFAELENEAAADESLDAAGGEGAEAPEGEIIEEDMILSEDEIVTMAALSGLSDSTIGLSANTASNWQVTGNTINGSVTGGTLFGYYLSASDTLTITNNKTGAATLSFDFTASGNFAVGSSVTVDGTEYTSATTSSFSKELAAGGSITIKLAADKCNPDYGANTISIAISNLSLVLADAGTITTTFEAAEYGSYTVSYGDTTETVGGANAPLEIDNHASVQYTMSITPTSGYKFVGWKNVTNDVYLSYETSCSAQFDTPCTIKPIVVSNDTAVFMVDKVYFTDLGDAVDYATSNSKTIIILVSNGTVSGSYNIPAGITLLIPHDVDNTMYGSAPSCTSYDSILDGSGNIAWVQPTAYRILTLAGDADITVDGAIELAGQHAASNGGKPYCGAPTGPLGWMKMESGSKITLNSGSSLYAWGYIQGSGTITAKSGAKVYENFQFTDFRGGTNTSALASNNLVFPINQYYVQNIEVPTVYEAGSEEYIATSIFMSNQHFGATVKFMGSGGMFVPVAGASITKDYIESRDRMQIEIDGGGELNSLTMSLGGTNIDSSTFVLPITNNVTINLNSGTTTINQSVALLPGVEMSIDKGAVLDVGYSETELNEYNTAGHNLIVYDYDQWTVGINTSNGEVVDGYFAFPTKRLSPLPYAPGRTYDRTEANDLGDAVVDVNGQIIASGFLYTTSEMDLETGELLGGGASIVSTQKTGSIVMNEGAGTDICTFQANDATELAIPMTSAKLKNGDGTYLETAGAAAGTTYDYCATHDKWYTGECDECSVPVYEITWVGAAGDLGAEEYSKDVVPTYKGDTPTKAQSGCTVYTFAGWKANDGTEYPTGTALPAATTDATYYAYFTESESHAWTVTYNFAKDGSSCTATRTCGNDASHNVTATATITGAEKTAATCTEKGWTTYIANFDEDWAETQTKEVQDIPATDHAWTVTYSFAEDGKSCTATRACANDASHNATATATITGAVKTAATCEGMGTTTYTATFAEDWAETQTKEVQDIPATDHAWTVTYNFAEDGSNCTATRACSNDASHVETATATVTSKVFEEPGCESVGETQYIATFTETWAETQYKYLENLPATDHDWGEPTFKWTKLYTEATATRTCKNDSRHVETEVVTATAEITTDPTCYAKGKTTYTATFTKDWTNGYVMTMVLQDVDNAGIKHNYQPTGYKWDVNNQACTVYVECVNDGCSATSSHLVYSTISTVPGTCKTPAETTYTAVFPEWTHGVTQTTSVTGETDPNNHESTEVTYKSISDTQHEVHYECCDALKATEGHTYVNGKCVCTKVQTFTVTWVVDGKTVKTETVEYGENATAPEVEAREGHSFAWDNDGKAIKATTTITGSYTAKSYNYTIKTYTMDIDGKYGEPVTETKTAVYGSTVSVYPEAKTGFTVDGDSVTSATIGTGENVLSVYYIRNQYSVKYMVDGAEYKTETYYYEAPVTALAALTKEGHTFSGWSAIPASMPAWDVTVTGSFTVNSYTLTIKDWESERIEIAKLTVPYGANLLEYLENVEVENIYKDGYVNKFSDEWWYYVSTDESDPVGESTTMPAENFTVFALFSSTGWMLYADGYRYVIDDCTQHTGWTLIKEADYTENGTGSAWYYLDTETGLRAEGVSRVPYPTDAIGGVSYAPDQESIDYATSKGTEFIDAETGLFIFGADGKFQSGTTGIGAYLNATRYAQNGHIAWHPGMVEAEGSYYYFIGDSEVGGNKLATGDVYVSRNTTEREFVKGGVYTFGADGKLCEYDGITEMADGKLRYYENAQLMLGAGLVEVEGKYIHVRSTGELVVNAEYWVAKDNDYGLDYGMYYFDENGFMVIPEVTLKEGVYYENGGWYLYENGVKAYNMGLVSAQGLNWYGEDGSVSHTGGQNEYIYVRSNAQLATGTYYVTNVGNDEAPVSKGEKCEFGEYGELLMGKDGIVNGYYYENNHIVYNAGLIEYGGGYIYVRSNGQAVKAQTYWITNTNDLMNAGFYEFGEDYLMVVDADKNGIVEENGTLYYYLNGVKQMGSGLVELDDGYIYVRTNGALAVGVYWITNVNDTGIAAGKYTFGSDGFMVK